MLGSLCDISSVLFHSCQWPLNWTIRAVALGGPTNLVVVGAEVAVVTWRGVVGVGVEGEVEEGVAALAMSLQGELLVGILTLFVVWCFRLVCVLIFFFFFLKLFQPGGFPLLSAFLASFVLRS